MILREKKREERRVEKGREEKRIEEDRTEQKEDERIEKMRRQPGGEERENRESDWD